MGFFSKSVSDTEWLAQIKPSFDAAIVATSALDSAIGGESIEGQITAVQEVLHKLPGIVETIKALPSPTSSEAQQAKKNLELALKDYVEGSKWGSSFLAIGREVPASACTGEVYQVVQQRAG